MIAVNISASPEQGGTQEPGTVPNVNNDFGHLKINFVSNISYQANVSNHNFNGVNNVVNTVYSSNTEDFSQQNPILDAPHHLNMPQNLNMHQSFNPSLNLYMPQNLNMPQNIIMPHTTNFQQNQQYVAVPSMSTSQFQSENQLSAEEEKDSERRVWTPDEDEAIKHLVAQFGTKSWSLIAEHIIKDFNIAGRSGKQCRERWHNHLGMFNISELIHVVKNLS